MDVFEGEGDGGAVGFFEGIIDGDAMTEAFHADVPDGLLRMGFVVAAADGHGDEFDLVVGGEGDVLEIVPGDGLFVEEEGEVGVNVAVFGEDAFLELGVLLAEGGEEFFHR